MDDLQFLQILADLQFSLGRAVTFKDILWDNGFSRSTAVRYMMNLISRNYVVKVAHGKYAIKSDDKTIKIGLMVLTPMDVFEYQSLIQLGRVSEYKGA